MTKKAEAATKAEFDALVEGCGLAEAELQEEREKTNRWAGELLVIIMVMLCIVNNNDNLFRMIYIGSWPYLSFDEKP